MFKKVGYLLFFTILSQTFFSCADSCSSTVKKETLNTDSIAAFRKKINADKKEKQLDSLFESRVKIQGFNGSVLVAQEGLILYQNAFGFANFKNNDTLKNSHSFQLASVSKTLTAAGILLLKDQNKLSLDDEVTKYFPTFPYKGISIKLLLSHRSGLPNYIDACEQYCEKPNIYNGKKFDNQAMLDLLIKKKPDAYALPNKKFEYCNTNYALLALIIEKVSEQSFADFMQNNLFTPLNMQNTWVGNSQYDSLHKNKTIGYKSNGKPEEDVFADEIVGDKSIYSTPQDLFKFDQALYSDKLLKKETLEEAFKGYSHEHKGKRNYGLGWRLIEDGETPKIVYHNGWWHGFNTVFYRIPENGITIIILSNKYNRGVYNVSDILSILREKTNPKETDEEENP
jgi:CubicO group peptidase (beta-lactamase class C family)